MPGVKYMSTYIVQNLGMSLGNTHTHTHAHTHTHTHERDLQLHSIIKKMYTLTTAGGLTPSAPIWDAVVPLVYYLISKCT